MFYNKRKTIGVFLNRAELEFQQVLSRSLTETAKQCDYNIVYLTSFGIRETETMYDLYEKNVVDFAPIEEFDAIIVALDTYDTPSFRMKLIEGLKTERMVRSSVFVRRRRDSTGYSRMPIRWWRSW